MLLLDLRLPDIHGSQLLPLLRQVPGCEHVPAVAVTAEHEFDFAGSGFDELWSKPLKSLKVLERIDVYLALASASRNRPPHHLEMMPPLPTSGLASRWTAQARRALLARE